MQLAADEEQFALQTYFPLGNVNVLFFAGRTAG
jgi:hypothetical protein